MGVVLSIQLQELVVASGIRRCCLNRSAGMGAMRLQDRYAGLPLRQLVTKVELTPDCTASRAAP